MVRFGKGVLFALMLAPVTAMAQGGFVDLFYVPSAELKLTDPNNGTITSDGGKGYGARLRAGLEYGAFLQGEYQQNQYDGFENFDFRTEATLFRAGFGVKAAESPLYGLVEYLRQKVDFKDVPSSFTDSGYGLHVGVQGSLGPSSVLYGQLGFVDVGDFGNGLEFLVGGAVNINATTAVFADYRQTTQEDDSGAEGKFTDLRVGLRVGFGS